MSLKFTFAGFGHAHINSLYKHVDQMDELTFVAACEPDDALREGTESAGIPVAYTSFDTMFEDVDCDVVAIGAVFGDRGALAIEALKRGKHVIADKPLCTRMSELNEIERLAKEKDLRVGCMFTQRGSRSTMKQIPPRI